MAVETNKKRKIVLVVSSDFLPLQRIHTIIPQFWGWVYFKAVLEHLLGEYFNRVTQNLGYTESI